MKSPKKAKPAVKVPTGDSIPANPWQNHRLAERFSYPGEGLKLPTPETLALIAAAASAGREMTPETAEEASDYAIFLWLMATERHNLTLRVKRSKEKGWHKHTSLLHAAKALGIPIPEDPFPSFDDFLRCVVNAKTPADSAKRLRDFFRAEVKSERGHEDEAAADARYVTYREKCEKRTLDATTWLLWAKDYRKWWKDCKAVKNRENVRKRSLKNISLDSQKQHLD